MTAPLSVAVIGGGFAGLSTALALKNIGCHVQVFEKTSALKTAPLGLLLQPAGVRALQCISPRLKHHFDQIACPTGDISLFCSLRGRKIGTLNQQEVIDGYQFPFMVVPRDLFYQALADELGHEHITLGHRFKEYFEDEQNGNIHSIFHRGHETHSDIIVGADGAYSAISEMIPLPYENCYRGTTAWYGIAKGISLSDVQPFVGFGFGPGQASGIFPLIHQSIESVAWWCSIGTWFGPEFDPQGDHHSLLADLFKSYSHGPLLQLVKHTPDIHCFDIYDKTPYPSNPGRGRATLVGDASHQAAPVLGYGVDQALEDAAVLARNLKSGLTEYGTNVIHLLRQYEYERYHKARQMTMFARIINNCFHARTKMAQYSIAYASPLAWHFTRNRYLENGLSSNL